MDLKSLPMCITVIWVDDERNLKYLLINYKVKLAIIQLIQIIQ